MRKPKLMVIGLDSIPLSILDTYKEHCPTIRRQMSRGVSGHALPGLPVWTPTNWAVLTTGAEAATTGATAWARDVNGERLSAFDRRAIACDTIYDSVARAGMTSLAIAYPGSYPTRRGNMVLAPLHKGLVSNAIAHGRILKLDVSPAGAARISLVDKPSQDVPAWIHKSGASSWKLGLEPGKENARHLLKHERWSEPIAVKVKTRGTTTKCMFRAMVFDDGKQLALTELYDVGELGAPASLCKKVLREIGPPVEHPTFEIASEIEFGKGGIPPESIMRLADNDMTAQTKWIADAAGIAMRERPYDVFYLHYHYPDSVLHAYLAASEGAREYRPEQTRFARKAVARAMRVCDGLVAELLKLAGPETTVLIVSDHGNVPNRYVLDLGKYLAKHGLMVIRKDGSVDAKRSRVIAEPSFGGLGAMIKAKEGRVLYKRTQDDLIDALLNWKTETGERVVALALRKKDAQLMGYPGPYCADVAWHYNSGFSWGSVPGGKLVAPCSANSNHGPQMPVTFGKTSDNMSFFVLTGPGVKRGMRWDDEKLGRVRLADMVPTICELSGVPTPLDAAGAVRRRMFKGAG